MIRSTVACSLSSIRRHRLHQSVSRSFSYSAASASSCNAILAATSSHQHQQHQTSSSSPLMAFAATAAAATTALLATSSSSNKNEASCEAVAAVADHSNSEMRALGKSLQASHERQMVRMAKLLHSLESLADEAAASASEMKEHEKKDAELQKAALPRSCECSSSQEEKDLIHITNSELESLSSNPQKVWEHIHSLKNGTIYGREDVKRILRAACTVLRGEPSLIDLRERTKRTTVKKESSVDYLKTVTVVGDLHGHFEDSLLKVLDMVSTTTNDKKETNNEEHDDYGCPWDGTGAVVFNGDFVDRGKNSIEVILVLLLLKLAYPNNVFLNRGNHEDSTIATVYGCRDELEARYNGCSENNDSSRNGTEQGVQDIWKEFEDVFASLPLAVRTESAVIMHGGLPMADFSLEQIANIRPKDRFKVKTMVEPSKDDHTCKLMQNIMWSDPQPEEGVSPNEDRGCGVQYGPDVVHNFLSDHGLKYLIRSHEPVDAGYELLECDENGMSAVTVFSAASYPAGAGFNHGAIVRLSSDNGGDATFHSYGEDSDDHNHNLTTKEKMSHTFKAFADVVARNRAALEEEFEYLASERARRRELKIRFKYPTLRNDGQPNRATAANSAAAAATAPVAVATSAATTLNNPAVLITPEQWADAMNHVLSHELPNVDWKNIQKFIAPGDIIDYVRFLNLHCSLSSYNETRSAGIDDHTRDTILKNHDAIFKVFKFLDVDNDGEVDRDEFCRGINELKKRNPDSAFSFDAETLFDSIDVDKSGAIELTELQHAFQACDVPYHIAVMMSLDEDKSGTIDRFEFKEGVKLLNARLDEGEKIPETDDEINRLFDELDESGDGELDTTEFEKFVREYYPH